MTRLENPYAPDRGFTQAGTDKAEAWDAGYAACEARYAGVVEALWEARDRMEGGSPAIRALREKTDAALASLNTLEKVDD